MHCGQFMETQNRNGFQGGLAMLRYIRVKNDS